jgi:putative nucleotidyltransferase with HDIG domain
MTSTDAQATAHVNVLKAGRVLVGKLSVCMRTARLYDTGNVNVQGAAKEVVEAVRTIHRMEGRARLALVLDFLALNDVRLKTDIAGHTTFDYIIQGFQSRGLGTIYFDEDVAPGEVIEFCLEYHRVRPDSEDPFGLLVEGMRRASIRTIRVEELSTFTGIASDEVLKKDIKQRSIRTFFQSIRLSRQILESADPRKLNFKRAKRVIQKMVDLITEDESVLLSLTTIKNYDEYTFNHSANVAVYAIALGQKLGLDRGALADLGMAGLFHDLGKIRVPREILNKPGRLSEDEWEIMKNHSVYGAEILLRSRELTDATIRCVLVAFEHHLNLDLGGYPRLRDRRDLNLFSKLVAISDCFDALTTPRAYRHVSYSPQEALSIMMEGRGTLFDPTLLKIFVNAVGFYPIGTLVEIGTGEIGVVFRNTSDAANVDRPLVKIFADATGKRIPERVEDLTATDEDGKFLCSIARTMDPGDYFESIEDYLEIL